MSIQMSAIVWRNVKRYGVSMHMYTLEHFGSTDLCMPHVYARKCP